MVLATKIFTLEKGLSLNDIANRIKGYSLLEREEALGREIEVGSRVSDLRMEGTFLVGTFEENFLITTTYKDETFKVPLTIRTEFRFFKHDDRTFLVVIAKKARANRIANHLSSRLSAEKGIIQEAWIPPSRIRSFFEGKMDSTKVIFFDNVRLPNVDKLSLYGSQLVSTDLYKRYLQLGTVWYVVFEPEDGLVIGITRNCIVTFFSKVDVDDAVAFISDRVVPLIE